MSEERTLIQKLIEVQAKLKAPKGNWNKFGKFNYRSGEDILTAVKPLNAEAGLLLTLSDEPVLVGQYQYIQATARITDGKDTHEVTAYARESLNKKGMDDSQVTGTASSYARKYALNGMYLIDDTKDADTNEYGQEQQNHQQEPQQQPQPQPEPITAEQVGQIKVELNEVARLNDRPVNEVLNKLTESLKFGVNPNWMDTLDYSKAEAVLTRLKQWHQAYLKNKNSQG